MGYLMVALRFDWNAMTPSVLSFWFWFGLVGFYGISTIVGYLIPNPLYTYILNI